LVYRHGFWIGQKTPLIALYFATTLEELINDRVLYVLEEDQFPIADDSLSPFAITETILYRPKHISARISSQGGLFTVHSSPAEPLNNDLRVKKWLIKQDCLLDLHFTLQYYGINEAFIFQDLDGLARYLNSKWIRDSPSTK